MRLRVLLPIFVLGLIAVVAVLIPAGTAIAESRTQQLQLQRASALGQLTQRAYAALERGDTAGLERTLARFADTYGEAVLVVDARGTPVAAVGDIAPEGAVADAATAALRGVPQWQLPTVTPWSARTHVVAEPVTTDGTAPAGAVVLRVDQTAARADVAGGWIAAGGAGAALLALLLIASVLWTNWVLRPVHALGAATDAVAGGRGFDLSDASGPPELRRLAASFTQMADRVETTLAQQRGLVADASHQLRNPLAAIRLRIDTLPRGSAGMGIPHSRQDSAGVDAAELATELAAIDEDLDRLEHTVDRMLTLADAEHRANLLAEGGADAADLPALSVSAAELLAPHAAQLAAAGVRLRADERIATVRCRRHDLAEIVGILADNAAKYLPDHGVSLTAAFERSEAREILTVSDTGPGLGDDELRSVGTRFWRGPGRDEQPGSGLGYAIVLQLASANRAEVTVDRSPSGGLRTRISLEAA